MKKIYIFFAVLMAALSTQAGNYFTINNDTLRVIPSKIGNVLSVPVRAHLDGRIDSWSLTCTFPSDMQVVFASEGPGMSVPYITSDGTASIYNAVLTVSNNNTVFSSTITDFGYWDYNNDGIYEPYGTIKWEAGDYVVMFNIHFYVQADCTGDFITIDGTLSSTYDWRSGTTGGNFYKSIYIYFAYLKGDVNGDDDVDINDVNLLIDYVLQGVPSGLDSYQWDAIDVNGNGVVDTNDITAVIAIVNGTNNLAVPDDPFSLIGGGDLNE